MRKLVALLFVSCALCGAPAILAQDRPDELVRPFCDLSLPETFCDCNKNGVADADDITAGTSQDANADGVPDECDADDCPCTSDRLEIVFAGQMENSVLNLATFEANQEVQSHVVINVVSDQIRGYSFGVAHDPQVLELQPPPGGLNFLGTPSFEFLGQGFTTLEPVANDGYKMAVVLSFTEPVVLRTERVTVANATYRVIADPGAAGTEIRFSEEVGSPPTAVVLTVDVLVFPETGNGNAPDDEVACKDGVDNDEDGLTDQDDPDCISRKTASRKPETVVDGLIRIGDAPPPVEPDCNQNGVLDADDIAAGTSQDADANGVPDECEEAPPLVDCNENGVADADDIAAGTSQDANANDIPDECEEAPPLVDCNENGVADADDIAAGTSQDANQNDIPDECEEAPPLVDCNENGVADADDIAAGTSQDANANDIPDECEPEPGPDCPEWAFYFGSEASAADHVIAGDTFPINLRNLTAASGYQLGVKVTTEGDSSTWEFSGELGGTPNTLVSLLVADVDAIGKDPETPNRATSAAFEVTAGGIGVAQGGAIGFAGQGDLLLFDTLTADSGIGGPGFTVGYIADIQGGANVIPATEGEECPLNEILIVSISGPAPPEEQPLSRGDADGSGGINVVDAVLIVQTALGTLPGRFNCDDILDSDDNGMVEFVDAIPPLRYVFQGGDPLPAPFRSCAMDPSADDLTCMESNCQ